jgi:hypothetical protein
MSGRRSAPIATISTASISTRQADDIGRIANPGPAVGGRGASAAGGLRFQDEPPGSRAFCRVFEVLFCFRGGLAEAGPCTARGCANDARQTYVRG